MRMQTEVLKQKKITLQTLLRSLMHVKYHVACYNICRLRNRYL